MWGTLGWLRLVSPPTPVHMIANSNTFHQHLCYPMKGQLTEVATNGIPMSIFQSLSFDIQSLFLTLIFFLILSLNHLSTLPSTSQLHSLITSSLTVIDSTALPPFLEQLDPHTYIVSVSIIMHIQKMDRSSGQS